VLREPSKMQVSTVSLNEVRGGVWLALTAILSHFSKLEVELDLLGSCYNIGLSCDNMETLWT
jgi:hypothetical protein